MSHQCDLSRGPPPPYQHSPGLPRGLYQVMKEKRGVRESLFRKVTHFLIERQQTYDTRQSSALGPGAATRRGCSDPQPRQPQGLVLPGGLALTWPWTTGQVTHVWIRQNVQTILTVYRNTFYNEITEKLQYPLKKVGKRKKNYYASILLYKTQVCVYAHRHTQIHTHFKESYISNLRVGWMIHNLPSSEWCKDL